MTTWHSSVITQFPRIHHGSTASHQKTLINTKNNLNFFLIFIFFFITGRGRVRFEVTLRLGNATLIMTSDSDNEDGKKKLNPHFTALLEKYVSIFIAICICHFSLVLWLLWLLGYNSPKAQPNFPFSITFSIFCLYCNDDAFMAV